MDQVSLGARRILVGLATMQVVPPTIGKCIFDISSI